MNLNSNTLKALLCLLIYIPIHEAFSQAQNDEQLIRKARQTSNEAIVRQDVETISNFWWDDYVVIRGSGVIEVGKEMNKANWKRIFQETPKTSFERIPSEVIISKNDPNLAWESGDWRGFNTYSKGGRYSAQWKKKDGVWKLQAELFVALEK